MSVSITAPPQNSSIVNFVVVSLTGNSLISFTTVQPSPNGLDLLWQYSADGGATFMSATDAGGGSVTGNPVLGDGPGADTWEWGTATDFPTGAPEAILRLTVSDAVFGGGQSSCERSFVVSNP